MFAALSGTNRTKLVKLLGMLGSNFGGERANAALLADKLVRAHGTTWDSLIVPAIAQQQSRQQQPPPNRTWRDVVAECQARSCVLSDWETGFLVSVASWRGRLTAKQQAKLNAIARRVGVEPAL